MTKRALILGIALLAVGGLALGRSWRYSGRLLSGWDAQFYYAQARSLAFRGTLDVTESLESTPFKDPFDPDARGHLRKPRRREGRIINKYPIGLSLLEIPPMVAGHSVQGLLGAGAGRPSPAGYAPATVAAVAACLLLYTVIGLVLLQRLLECSYPPGPAVLGVLATWLGTSLFYYSAIFPFMPHGAAFTLVVAVFWQVQRLRDCPGPGPGRFSLLAATFGLLFLVRPQQILLLPLVAASLVRPLARAARRALSALMPAAILAAACGLQVLANDFQLGHPTTNAYAASREGFDWLRPRLDTVLFSPHRGLLWINPVVVVALAGFAARGPRPWIEPVLLAHGAVQAYLIACWSSPEQGDAFGPRMWIECTPLVAFGTARLFTHARPAARCIGLAACAAALGWTLLLLAMYVSGSIGPSATHGDIVRGAVSRIGPG